MTALSPTPPPGTVGLTLGKLAPLHLGHQHVIETALGEVERLIVLIYDCPEVTDVPIEVRARWIRDLYPAVQVIEARGGPLEVGSDPAVIRAHDAYIRATLGPIRITHFYSSEFYGAHVSAGLGAVDRRVDEARARFPISATGIRRAPYEKRRWVSPRVYRDLVTNVLVVGAPSTGKTTLCEHLARVHRTVWMPEYGREYWAENQVERRLTPEQLVEIARGHLEREEALLQEANRVLFTDTNALTTLLFARYYHGAALPELEALAERAAARHAVTFLCEADIPYDATWDRSGEVSRAEMQRSTVEELERRTIRFTRLRGSVDERARRVAEVLRERGVLA